jgi:hypothetical protein
MILHKNLEAGTGILDLHSEIPDVNSLGIGNKSRNCHLQFTISIFIFFTSRI